MKDYIDQLVRSLLQKQSLEECSLQELKELATNHPYFGAAQLLFAKKLQKENAPEYSFQVEKTSLFFNNPLWLDQLLNDKGDVTSETRIKTETGIKFETQTTIDEANKNKVEVEEANDVKSTSGKLDHDSLNEGQASQEEFIINPEPPPKLQSQSQPLLRKEETSKSTDFVFEPYHTVDYFASQGIRFKEEEKPADKFGQQLKSFTEWLKTLKRLPVSEIVRHSSPATEQKVEQMAEASLTEGEVVTEAMAEVWAKQGNQEKAISIYEKLSLLDPAKSAYFAAKIEDLKR